MQSYGWSFLEYITTLASLVTTGIGILKMFLICHVTSRDCMLKRLCKFMDKSPLWEVITLPFLGAIGLVLVAKRNI